ncbi:MAG: hypothetical protein IT270_03880, partial [Saprospiraceae bacterium]|nr:hypothetical protein [Saprospiraceae bacterium]
ELKLLSNLSKLTNEAKKGRVNGQTVSSDSLLYWYGLDTPNSLENTVTDYYSVQLSNFFGEIALASGGTYIPGAPSGQGGTFGGYLFDENGLEFEQMIEKGQFGATLYNHANHLAGTSPFTAATADRMLAIFGANPTFPNSYQAALHARPDVVSANYAARRDKNDGSGFYTSIRDNFIKLQAAAKAGDDYTDEQEDAIHAIMTNWEKSNFATVINYLNSVIGNLSATNPTDAQKASALHAYSECVGFVHGFRTVAAEHRNISDAQIDALLVLLNAPYNGTPTSYKFVTDPVNELPKLSQVIADLKTIYGFSDLQMEDFKKNWVAEQNR